MIKVKVINKSNYPLPEYATSGSAGMDLRANIEQEITLKPLERKLFPTGLFIQLPLGYEAQVRPRSGLALKKGLTVLNAPGTVDAKTIGVVKLDNIGESLKEENTETDVNLLYSIEGAIILPRVSNPKFGKIYAELYSDI